MNQKDQLDESELRKDAPVLFGLSKQDPFLVEDGFFERFPHEVQALASKPTKAPMFTWLKRVAIALPAAAVVLFAIHSLRTPEVPVASVPITQEALLSTTSGQFTTQSILTGLPEKERPTFDSVTVQLTPSEAMAYVDQHDIDLTEYLYQQ